MYIDAFQVWGKRVKASLVVKKRYKVVAEPLFECCCCGSPGSKGCDDGPSTGSNGFKNCVATAACLSKFRQTRRNFTKTIKFFILIPGVQMRKGSRYMKIKVSHEYRMRILGTVLYIHHCA